MASIVVRPDWRAKVSAVRPVKSGVLGLAFFSSSTRTTSEKSQPRRHHQRRHALARLGVGLGVALQQQLDEIDVAPFGGADQRGVALAVGGIDHGAAFSSVSATAIWPASTAIISKRLAVGVGLVGILALEQRLAHLLVVALAHRLDDRRESSKDRPAPAWPASGRPASAIARNVRRIMLPPARCHCRRYSAPRCGPRSGPRATRRRSG